MRRQRRRALMESGNSDVSCVMVDGQRYCKETIAKKSAEEKAAYWEERGIAEIRKLHGK